jgi:hypothetical protein
LSWSWWRSRWSCLHDDEKTQVDRPIFPMPPRRRGLYYAQVKEEEYNGRLKQPKPKKGGGIQRKAQARDQGTNVL